MPYRAAGLLVVIGGVIAVVALIVVGVNVRRAACRGPRWKRVLLSAGLALLVSLGIPACSDGGDRSPIGQTDPESKKLAATKEWKSITKIWTDAADIAAGKHGPYPFDADGKKVILEALGKAAADTEALRERGLLADHEAALLSRDLAWLTRKVQGFRSTESRNATCYKPMMIIPARESAKRLADRLPLLEKLAASGKLKLAVVEKILLSIEGDLAVLDDKEQLKMLDRFADERDAAEKTRDDVRKHAKKLRDRLDAFLKSGKLRGSKDWKTVEDALAFCRPLAASGKSTSAQREEADGKLKALAEAANRLAAGGLISSATAELLAQEAGAIRTDIHRNPPTDFRGTCYEMVAFSPARESFDRLQKRLPLLESLVAGGKVRPAAVEKVLGRIEKDVAVLSSEEALKDLLEPNRKAAEELRDKVKAQLEKLKALLEKR
ncbi:MAG: hypothetical protein ACYTAF_12455 [Planctomycetota bacterium]|jgi:hypothetical protein